MWTIVIEEGLKTEEKANVVAAVWGTEFLQFIVALAVLHEDDFEE